MEASTLHNIRQMERGCCKLQHPLLQSVLISPFAHGVQNGDQGFAPLQNGYYAIGEKIGQAWNAGAGLMKP